MKGEHPTPGSAPRPGRLLFLDSLRGVAALWVTLEHIYNALRSESRPQLVPEPLHSFLVEGEHGVEIFFVLSGFVIAHSVGAAVITPGYAGRFALRRSLRLDPPYWAAILTYLAAAWLMGRSTYSELGALELASNFVYLNHVLGIFPAVVQVGWTLCLEIQFYLFFILNVGVAQAVRARLGSRWFWGVLALPLVVSCAWQLGAIADPPGYEVIFLQPWYLFGLGAMTSWVLAGRVSKYPLYALWAAVLAAAAVQRDIAPAVGLAAGVSIYFVGAAGRFGSVLADPVTLYLGRISYSLYLIHPLVGSRPLRAVLPRLGDDPSGGVLFLLFVGALAASVLAADVFYRVVERPSLWLAQRVRVVKPAPAAHGS